MFRIYRQENTLQRRNNYQSLKIILMNSLYLIICELNGTYK
jgi:hypothetical protein